MPYDFKKLSDVTENTTVPEDGKVLYEKDGEIHRAPIKQGDEKKVKYITNLFLANSSGNVNDYYDESGNNVPTYLEGSDVPYVITSSDLSEGKYAKMTGAELCQLYEEGVEIKIGNSVVFQNSSDIPSCLEEFKTKPLEAYITAENLAEVNYSMKELFSGNGIKLSDKKSYLGASFIALRLSVSDSEYGFEAVGSDVQIILFQAEE